MKLPIGIDFRVKKKTPLAILYLFFLNAFDFTYQLISKNQIFAKEMWVAHPFDVILKIES